jgi:hypothetical protein
MKVLTDADWNHIRSLYDGEIAYTDRAVGALIEGLEERGLLENSLLVFLSDHGEEFFEHGGFEHGHTMYNEQLKVPLMFILPDVIPRGVRVRRQVRLLDVMPTILDILQIDPGTHLEGVSLNPLLTGEGEIKPNRTGLLPDQIAFAEAMLHGREQKCVVAYPWKLIYDTVTREEMVFNLDEDPGEYSNLDGQVEETQDLLDETMFKTLFGLSNTWYIELAGGPGGHIFDLEIVPHKRPMAGTTQLVKILDEKGHIMKAERLPALTSGGDIISLEDLDLKGTVTLAFQVSPKRVQMGFDFSISGEPATSRTFMGEALTNPEAMPFTARGGRREPTNGAPPSRPAPPYIMIWHQGSGFEGERPVRLDDEIKKELRALGYIQ